MQVVTTIIDDQENIETNQETSAELNRHTMTDNRQRIVLTEADLVTEQQTPTVISDISETAEIVQVVNNGRSTSTGPFPLSIIKKSAPKPTAAESLSAGAVLGHMTGYEVTGTDEVIYIVENR